MDEPHYDVFDRSKRSKTKPVEWKVPNQLRTSIKKKISEGEDIQDYITSGTAFKEITYKFFGVTISEIKERGERDVSLFIIYCGGAKKELNYFKAIIRNEKIFEKIKICYVTGTDQIEELVKKAIEDIEKSLGGRDINDNVYLLTDMDNFREDIIAQQSSCFRNNINMIVSNPCFEIWLYYSQFENTPDFKPSAPLKISHEFKTYLNSISQSTGGINPCTAIFEIETANKNSLRNYSEDEYKLPELFSTQMHILGKKLLELGIKENLQIIKNSLSISIKNTK